MNSLTKEGKIIVFGGLALLVIFVMGLYWWQRGDSLPAQPPSDTKLVDITPAELRPADFDTPNVPHCYPVANQRVVMRLDDSNMPLCVTMSEKQELQVTNATNKTLAITLAGHAETVEIGRHIVFGQPIGTFLAEGVHRIVVAEQPDRTAEVYVLSMNTLREACAHSEIPAQREKDSTQDPLSSLVVVRWTDERGGENIVPLPYEPETDFEGCSESAKEFLRHLPSGP